MLFVHKYGALYLFIRWLEVCCAAGLVFVSRFLLYNGCLAYSAFKFIQFFFFLRRLHTFAQLLLYRDISYIS